MEIQHKNPDYHYPEVLKKINQEVPKDILFFKTLEQELKSLETDLGMYFQLPADKVPCCLKKDHFFVYSYNKLQKILSYGIKGHKVTYLNPVDTYQEMISNLWESIWCLCEDIIKNHIDREVYEEILIQFYLDKIEEVKELDIPITEKRDRVKFTRMRNERGQVSKYFYQATLQDAQEVIKAYPFFHREEAEGLVWDLMMDWFEGKEKTEKPWLDEILDEQLPLT